jgi:hypothetical protein
MRHFFTLSIAGSMQTGTIFTKTQQYTAENGYQAINQRLW